MNTFIRLVPGRATSCCTRAFIATIAFSASFVGPSANALAAEPPDPKSSKLDLRDPDVGRAEKPALPPVFSTLKLSDALAKARADNKLLVIKFTAEWCGPCKMMDRTSWRDPRVEAWVNDHAIAIQVDVDKSPDVAKDYNISAMPTMVAQRVTDPKDPQTVGRRLGYMSADQLMGWLDTSLNGEKPIGGMEAQVKPDPNADTKLDNKLDTKLDKRSMMDRMGTLRELTDNRKFDQATQEALWLWDNMLKREPAMYGVRRSFFAGDIKRLVEKHPPAHDAFANLRDALETKLKTDQRSFEDLLDWIALNGSLADDEKTLAWFDRIKDQPDSGPTISRVGFTLVQLLEDKERWSDAGRLIRDPVGDVQLQHRFKKVPMGANMDAQMREEMQKHQDEHFRDSSARTYALMLAGGREAEAKTVREAILKLEDSGAMRSAMVSWALKVGQPRGDQVQLLEQAAKSGTNVAEVQSKLLKALGSRGG